ncbi:hypothetical protein EVAR_2904_1 [Eumeta japonica]|uniref:Uncharacterized protein n=1 Tax=Eumeta variegata TaxID=151549 RepID=A0A4C1T0Q3_EUMVA|nr:hypothetical protein EVAR_2904_1 [Eumeta japonica]
MIRNRLGLRLNPKVRAGSATGNETRIQVDFVANPSSSLPSYVSLTAPDNGLPLSEDPDGIFPPAPR